MKWRNKFILLKSFSSMKGRRFLSACHKASVSARPVLQRSSVFPWNVFFLPNDSMWLTGQMSGYILADILWTGDCEKWHVGHSSCQSPVLLLLSEKFLDLFDGKLSFQSKWADEKVTMEAVKFYASGVADSQLITGFLAFPLLTPAYLTSDLLCYMVLSSYFTDSCCFPAHLCKLSTVFQMPSSAGVFWITVVPVFFWIQFLTCAYLLVSWCLYSKHNNE